MKECMITNIACMGFGAIAISVACHVTESIWPLFGFLLIPKYEYRNHNQYKD